MQVTQYGDFRIRTVGMPYAVYADITAVDAASIPYQRNMEQSRSSYFIAVVRERRKVMSAGGTGVIITLINPKHEKYRPILKKILFISRSSIP